MFNWQRGIAPCALCWPLLLLAPSNPPPVSTCVRGSALYGMASARSLVIGSWAHCFACRPFFRPFVVSFFFSLSSRSLFPFPSETLALICEHTHTQNENIYTSTSPHWSRLLDQLSSSAAFTTEQYFAEARAHSSSTNSQSLFLSGNLNTLCTMTFLCPYQHLPLLLHRLACHTCRGKWLP